MKSRLLSFLVFLILMVVGAFYAIKGLFFWGNTALNRQFLQSFSKWALPLVRIQTQFIHPERLDAVRPAILIGNHQSGMDLGILGKLCPTDTVIIGKKELFYIPFVGWFLKAAGNLLIDRSKGRQAKDALLGVAKIMRAKNLNVAIMPEGTRNKNQAEKILPFKRGAFLLAIQGQFPVVAVVCSSLHGKAVWENHEWGGGKIVLSVLGPFSTEGLVAQDAPALADRIWKAMSEELNRINRLAEAYDRIR